MLLVNYRPEYTHSWGNKTYYTQLRLDPLGQQGAEEMLTALVGDSDEVRPLKAMIIERTGGNPFFMEERCRRSSMRAGWCATARHSSSRRS